MVVPNPPRRICKVLSDLDGNTFLFFKDHRGGVSLLPQRWWGLWWVQPSRLGRCNVDIGPLNASLLPYFFVLYGFLPRPVFAQDWAHNPCRRSLSRIVVDSWNPHLGYYAGWGDLRAHFRLHAPAWQKTVKHEKIRYSSLDPSDQRQNTPRMN